MHSEIPAFDDAVDRYGAGPEKLVLVGPPGTGKTRALQHSFLMPAVDAGMLGTLCCSYTRAAANEMGSRLPDSLRHVSQTMHSAALVTLKRFEKEWLLYDGAAGTVSKPGARGGTVEHVPGHAETTLRGCVLAAWDKVRNMQPDALLAGAKRPLAEGKMSCPCDPLPFLPLIVDHARDFAKSVDLRRCEVGDFDEQVRADVLAYEAEKVRAGAMDFADMLYLALACPAVGRPLLILDEAQDSTKLQWRLFLHWAESSERVVVAGDPDQSIHEWAGAGPEVFHELMLGGTYALRRLAQSYRVPRAPYELARSIILRNPGRIDAPYEPKPEQGQVRGCQTLDACMDAARSFLAQERSVFVLARTERLLRPFAVAFDDEGIPYTAERGRSAMNSASGAMRAASLLQYTREGKAWVLPMRKAVAEMPAKSGLFAEGWTKKAADAWFVQRIAGIVGPDGKPDEEALELLVEGDYPFLNRAAVLALGELDLLTAAGLSPAAATSFLRIAEKSGLYALANKPAVTLTTMHASKGRAASLVIVVAARPWGAREAYRNGAPEAERRLLYVACTRATDAVLVERGYQDVYPELEGVV